MANTAFGHDATLTTPGSTTNTALVRWANTSGSSLNNTANILSDGSNITLNARGEVRFADADSSNYIALESPATVGTTYTMALPAAVPSANDYLKVTSYSGGAGVLEWAAVSAGGAALTGSTNNTITTVTGANAIQGEANLTFDGTNLYLINSATGSSSNLMVNSSATSGTTPARLILRVGSGNAGDAFISFHNQAGSGTEWQLGMDTSDSSKFKLGQGGGVHNSTFFEANAAAATRSIIFHTGNGNNTNHGVLFFDSPNANTGLEDLPNTGAIYGQQAIRTTTIGQIGMNWNDASGGRGYGLNIKGFTYYNHGLSLISWTKSLVTTQANNQGAAIAIMCRRHDGEDNTDTYGSTSNLVRIGANDGGSRFFFTYGGVGYADDSWTTFSDNRLKFNQEVVPYGLNTVMQMQPKIYDKYSGGIEDGVVTLLDEAPRRQIGFVAQEIKALIPEVVADTDENNGWYSLEDGKLMAVVVKAIQELNAKVDALGS